MSILIKVYSTLIIIPCLSASFDMYSITLFFEHLLDDL